MTKTRKAYIIFQGRGEGYMQWGRILNEEGVEIARSGSKDGLHLRDELISKLDNPASYEIKTYDDNDKFSNAPNRFKLIRK